MNLIISLYEDERWKMDRLLFMSGMKYTEEYTKDSGKNCFDKIEYNIIFKHKDIPKIKMIIDIHADDLGYSIMWIDRCTCSEVIDYIEQKGPDYTIHWKCCKCWKYLISYKIVCKYPFICPVFV